MSQRGERNYRWDIRDWRGRFKSQDAYIRDFERLGKMLEKRGVIDPSITPLREVDKQAAVVVPETKAQRIELLDKDVTKSFSDAVSKKLQTKGA